MSQDALFRSSPRKRGPSARPWIPAISAFTRVFDALCAGMSGGCAARFRVPCRRRLTQIRASRPLQPIRKELVIRFRRQRLAREAIMAAKEISVKKYVVRLSGEERERLETLIRKGKSPARRVLKARILLKADVSEAGKGWSDNRIIEALETSPSMVYR